MTSEYIKNLSEYQALSKIRFERFYRNMALGLECQEEISNAYTQELCQNGCIVKKEIDFDKLQNSPFSLFEDEESHYLLWLCHCIVYNGKSLLSWINDYINNISNITRGGINTYKRNGWSVHVLYVYQLVNYNFAYNVLPVAIRWNFNAKSIIDSFGNEYRSLSNTAKFILKIACFIHDIGVQIGINDHESLGIPLVKENYSMLKVTNKDLLNNGVQLTTEELNCILQIIVGNHQLINQVAAEVSDYMIFEKIFKIKNTVFSKKVKKFLITEFCSVIYLLGAADMMAIDDSLLSVIKFDELSEAKDYIQRIIMSNDYVRDYKKYGIKRLKCFVNDSLKNIPDNTIISLICENGCESDQFLKFMYEVQGIGYGVAAIKPLNNLTLSIKFISILYRMVIRNTTDYKNVLIKIDSDFCNEYTTQLLCESIEIIDKKLDYQLVSDSSRYIFTVYLCERKGFQMFQLTKEYLAKNLCYFLCDYNDDSYKKIVAEHNFLPESFTVYDKMCGKELIYFREISFKEWCNGLIFDQICKLTWERDVNSLKDKIIDNVLFLLSYKVNDKMLAENIYNQEFVDIIRRVIYFTVYGKCDSDIYTAKEFNGLAYRIVPHLLNIIEARNYDLQKIFKLSVTSGLMGLDMKGAPAAASNYANSGIPMKKYADVSDEDAAKELLEKLEIVAKNADSPVFYWDKFIERVQNAKRVVWMTDDYIESFFDLYFIQKLITQFPNVNIDIIPKNGRFGNDMSWQDLEDIIQLPCFEVIKGKVKAGHITVNRFGPQMGAANLSKLSAQCVDSILRADFLVTKGCRIHEMLQGGINKEMFSAYIVTRELSEIVTGFNSKYTPILLLHSQPGEYLFWGISYDNAKKDYTKNRKEAFTSCCTIKEHETRKKMKSIEEVVYEFNCIYSSILSYKGDLSAVYRELEILKNKIDTYTINNYLSNHKRYIDIHNGINMLDKAAWDFFISAVREYFGNNFSDINVLDVGTGPGRDLLFGQQLGFKMVGCDKCKEFVDHFNQTQINAPSYIYGDACQLPFENEAFDIVRQNASLVHVPIIGMGYGADLAISESYRVLKEGGVLYLLVKEGSGINIVDTNEELGKRVFQYYEDKDIRQILERNNFKVLNIEEIEEIRQGVLIKWLVCAAIKNLLNSTIK